MMKHAYVKGNRYSESHVLLLGCEVYMAKLSLFCSRKQRLEYADVSLRGNAICIATSNFNGSDFRENSILLFYLSVYKRYF